jgi:hypothetical protein
MVLAVRKVLLRLPTNSRKYSTAFLPRQLLNPRQWQASLYSAFLRVHNNLGLIQETRQHPTCDRVLMSSSVSRACVLGLAPEIVRIKSSLSLLSFISARRFAASRFENSASRCAFSSGVNSRKSATFDFISASREAKVCSSNPSAEHTSDAALDETLSREFTP